MTRGHVVGTLSRRGGRGFPVEVEVIVTVGLGFNDSVQGGRVRASLVQSRGGVFHVHPWPNEPTTNSSIAEIGGRPGKFIQSS